MKYKFLIVFLIVVFSVSADVIYFNNGDIDEGYATVDGDSITILSRNEMNKYGMPTNKIKAIEYGVWIEDKGKEVQALAAIPDDSGILTSKQLNKISNMKIKGLNFNNILNDLTTTKGILSAILFLGIIVCFIVAFVGNIIVLVDAFKNNVLWGIFSLLFPIVLLIYLFGHYSGRKGRMFFWIYIFPILWIVATVLTIGRLN